MATSGSNYIIDDGVIVWFNGPEWDDVVKEVFDQAAGEVVTAAQRDAPWADRSGAARAGLEAKATQSRSEISLYLYHTVEHGLWLEVIQSGRFGTIMPTLEKYSPRIMRNAAAKVAKARRGR